MLKWQPFYYNIVIIVIFSWYQGRPQLPEMDDYIERLDFPYMTGKNHFNSPLDVLLEKKTFWV